jgi:hypothetical protein
VIERKTNSPAHFPTLLVRYGLIILGGRLTTYVFVPRVDVRPGRRTNDRHGRPRPYDARIHVTERAPVRLDEPEIAVQNRIHFGFLHTGQGRQSTRRDRAARLNVSLH